MRALILNVFVPNRLVTFQLSLPVAGFIESIMKTKKPMSFRSVDGKSIYYYTRREKEGI